RTAACSLARTTRRWSSSCRSVWSRTATSRSTCGSPPAGSPTQARLQAHEQDRPLRARRVPDRPRRLRRRRRQQHTCAHAPPARPPAPPPPPPPRLAPPLNVQRCLTQVVYPGRTVANSVVPDTIKIDLSQPAGFPNGRRLTDQVIDTELAWLFLDVASQGV